MTSDDDRAFEVFGAVNYVDYSTIVSDVPDGARKVIYVNVVNPVQTASIQTSAAAAPGSVWYVLGEPNAHGTSVEEVLSGLQGTYAAIMQADPTALITSPSILNFNFTCINCGGYPSGASWISSFVSEYESLFGEPPPIDIWAIDVFPIVWPGGSFPAAEAFPTVRDDIVVEQISDYRAWLDTDVARQNQPIWVTEFGLHWGFPNWIFGIEGCSGPSPHGDYLEDDVIAYLERAYTWFEANATAMKLERWFTFSSYRDIQKCQGDSGNGLTLLDAGDATGQLTGVGQFYNDWIRGIR